MKKNLLLVLLCAGLSCFCACQSDSSSTAENDGKSEKTTAVDTDKGAAATSTDADADKGEPEKQNVAVMSKGSMQKDGITLIPVSDSPTFPDAKISLEGPTDGGVEKAGNLTFKFGVDDYELGNQTPDAEQKLCANSAKGQHIHLILNNAPYSAHYTNEFDRELQDGHYVMLAFLSRSYHESLKHKDAAVLSQFTVGDKATEEPVDLSTPHLFYSRPKGTYLGENDIKKVMLDFYVVNATLAASGFKVRATINGKTQFLLSKWQPYFMEGLPEGKNTVKLELLGKDGKVVPGPYNVVERSFELYKEEPAKAAS